ncbi:UDP-N-acetylmuramate--L-alanine ligase, partial [bacterium]|nr:UDP-N-acetylmuramate--L-alanine ligase [bacterium]
TEIRVTLDGAKRSMNRRLVCIFQPHRYTRTRDLLEVFPTSFEAADLVVITEVYSANEQKIRGISGKLIVEKMKANGFSDVYFIANKSMVASKLIPMLRPNDVVITMGAGDISSVGKEIVAQLKSAAPESAVVEGTHSHPA